MDKENGYRTSFRGGNYYAADKINSIIAKDTRAADSYSQHRIDLNEHLVRNKPETFFFRMNSNAMTGAGIFSGDILIVDRSITEMNGKVVIAVLDGEMMVRRLETSARYIRLIPE